MKYGNYRSKVIDLLDCYCETLVKCLFLCYCSQPIKNRRIVTTLGNT